MLLTKILSIRESFRAIDKNLLLIVVTSLALGSVISLTGTAQFISDILLYLLEDSSKMLIISVFSIVFMNNINQNKSKITILAIGIFFSVIIYYLNNFFGVIGKNEKLPLIVSVWFPLLILFFITSIGIVRINEK